MTPRTGNIPTPPLNCSPTSVGQTAVGLGLTSKLAESDYNRAGQITELRRFDGVSTLLATSTLAYDDLGRLTSLVHTPVVNPGTDTITYAYQYDASSRITQLDSSTDGLTSYNYDELGQLTAADFTRLRVTFRKVYAARYDRARR